MIVGNYLFTDFIYVSAKNADKDLTVELGRNPSLYLAPTICPTRNFSPKIKKLFFQKELGDSERKECFVWLS